MSDFKAKMHQIVCRPGLGPRSHWGSLQRSPDPLARFLGPTSKEGEGRGRKEERMVQRAGRCKEKEKGKAEEGEEGESISLALILQCDH